MLWHFRKLACWVMLAVLAVALPVQATEIYLNGVRVAGLKNADLQHCSVKFDLNGDVHILSPGYRMEVAADGSQRIVGQSDFEAARASSAKPKMRYVLVYEPNPKVNFAFDVWVNSKSFRKIGLDSGKFTVEMTQDMIVGKNALRIIAKAGDALPGGTEIDTTSLRIYRGEAAADGTFKAKAPAVWELVRTAVDRQPLDRAYEIYVE